jgi:hypothetical protein
VGKLHNDRYIPFHPQLKDMLDDWIVNHRTTGDDGHAKLPIDGQQNSPGTVI